MTEQMTPAAADKARKIVTAMRDAMRRDEHAYPEAKFLADLSGYIKDLEALLPPPTLADMTPEERDACQWMQADLNGYGSRVVILNPGWDDGRARVMWMHTRTGVVPWRNVTPRPDLPRMEWPGDKKPAPALPDGWRLADHQTRGRVIVTRPEPDADGYVYYVRSKDRRPAGFNWECCPADELTFLDAEPEDDQ